MSDFDRLGEDLTFGCSTKFIRRDTTLVDSLWSAPVNFKFFSGFARAQDVKHVWPHGTVPVFGKCRMFSEQHGTDS